MRLLMLTSEFAPAVGGIGTYACEMARAAASLGVDVTVVAPDYGADGPADGEVGGGFRIERFHGGAHSWRTLPHKIVVVGRAVRRCPYDVVHAVDWPFFVPAAIAHRSMRARLVLTVHGTEINRMQAPLKRAAIRLTGALGENVEVVGNSGFTRDLFGLRFPRAAGRVRAVPLGVADFWHGPRAGRADARRRLQIGSDKVVIVTVARLTRRKGHLLMFEALGMLPAALRTRVLWLVIGPDGEPDCVRDVTAAAAQAPCEVRLLGWRPDTEVRDIYGAADLFCLAGRPEDDGRVEGFGLVYLEAGACGLASVATAVGGVRDAVVDGETGLLVAPSSAEVAQAIATLIEDGGRREAMGRAATEHARRMSWRRCAAATYRLGGDQGLPAPAGPGSPDGARRRSGVRAAT